MKVDKEAFREFWKERIKGGGTNQRILQRLITKKLRLIN